MSIRVAPLVLGITLMWAPLPARAQGGGSANNLQTQLNALSSAAAALQTALASETSARQSADTTLQANISSEAAARAAADTTLATNISSEASSRAAADTALDARVDKLEGNITATDLEGTYNLYMVATALELNGSGGNTITSYVVTGTMTFAAGGTGQVANTVAAGRLLTERLPGQTWLGSGASASGAFDGSFSWVYNNGVVTVTNGDNPGDINDYTVAAGGQVMVGVQGGPPGNIQFIVVLTRQPSI